MATQNFNLLKFVVLPFFSLSLFWGCTKHPSVPSTIYIPENIKQYSLFKSGSFWVYKNEFSNKTDSAYIQNIKHSFTEGSADLGPSIELYDIFYGGAFYRKSHFWPGGSEFELNNETGFLCMIPDSLYPGYSFVNGPDYRFKIINIYDSITLNSNIFYNVIETRSRSIISEYDSVVYLVYLARSIGLIKLELHQNNVDSTWSLLRFHVLQ